MISLQGWAESEDRKPECRNPNGCNGKQDHQDKVAQLGPVNTNCLT